MKYVGILLTFLDLQCLAWFTVHRRNSNICVAFEIRDCILASPKERKILLRARAILLRDNFPFFKQLP